MCDIPTSTLALHVLQTVVPILSFDIYDDDTYDSAISGPDLLEKTSYVIYQIPPTNFNSTPELHVANVTSNQSRSVPNFNATLTSTHCP